MKALAFTVAASADLNGIWDYTETEWNLAEAQKYTTEIRDVCRALARGQECLLRMALTGLALSFIRNIRIIRTLNQESAMKTMSATLASKEFGRFIDAAQREPVLLTKKDRPVAVTVSVADWEELVALRIERGVAAGLADAAEGRVTEMTDEAIDQRLARFRTRHPEA